MKILYNTLKPGGTKEHFRQVKVPGTTPYWKTWEFIALGSIGLKSYGIKILASAG